VLQHAQTAQLGFKPC